MADSDWVDDPSVSDEWVDDKTPQKESFGKGLARAAIDTVLPVGGAIGAGLLATPETMGIATIPAAAAGYAGGKSAARLLNHYLLGDELPDVGLTGVVKQGASDFAEGAAAEVGGQVIGKGLEMAAPYVGKAVNSAGETLGNYAEKTFAKRMGAGAKEFENPAQVKAMGRWGLDNDLAGPYKSAEEMLAQTQNVKRAAGQSMDDAYKAVDEGVGTSLNPLDTAVEVEAQLAPTYKTAINKSEVGQLENTIESILARGNKDISLAEAQSLKAEVDAVAYPKGKKPLDPSPKQQMAADASRIIKEQIDEAAATGAELLGNKDLIEKLAQARKSYGMSRQAGKLLERQVGKEGAGVGSQINWTVDPVKFGASVVRKLGPNAKATTAMVTDKISKLLLRQPKLAELAQKNPAAFKSAVLSLSKNLVPHMKDALPHAADLNELDKDSSTPAWEKSPYPDGGANSAPVTHDIAEEVQRDPQRFGKFAPVLQKAASRGPQGIAATHFVLQQTNPEYRQLFSRGENGE